jgi:transposase-like protein
MGKRSGLDVSARREAVLGLLRREESWAVLARRYGISEQTLYRWRDEFLAGGEAALGSGQGGADVRDRQIEELKREVARRDQVIGELTIANRILKELPKASFESRTASGGSRDGPARALGPADEGPRCVGHPDVELVPSGDPRGPSPSARPAAEECPAGGSRAGGADGHGESLVQLPADCRDVRAAPRGCPRRSIQAGGRFGFRSGKVGRRTLRRNSTPW